MGKLVIDGPDGGGRLKRVGYGHLSKQFSLSFIGHCQGTTTRFTDAILGLVVNRCLTPDAMFSTYSV